MHTDIDIKIHIKYIYNKHILKIPFIAHKKMCLDLKNSGILGPEVHTWALKF